MISARGGIRISELRELRNEKNRLLCKANDITGEVQTEGTHKASYLFVFPVGSTFIIVRDNIKSVVTRTEAAFIVNDYSIAA